MLLTLADFHNVVNVLLFPGALSHSNVACLYFNNRFATCICIHVCLFAFLFFVFAESNRQIDLMLMNTHQTSESIIRICSLHYPKKFERRCYMFRNY